MYIYIDWAENKSLNVYLRRTEKELPMMMMFFISNEIHQRREKMKQFKWKCKLHGIFLVIKTASEILHLMCLSRGWSSSAMSWMNVFCFAHKLFHWDKKCFYFIHSRQSSWSGIIWWFCLRRLRSLPGRLLTSLTFPKTSMKMNWVSDGLTFFLDFINSSIFMYFESRRRRRNLENVGTEENCKN